MLGAQVGVWGILGVSLRVGAPVVSAQLIGLGSESWFWGVRLCGRRALAWQESSSPWGS